MKTRYAKKTASVFIPHYGCKNDCVFCNQVKISGMDKKIDYAAMKDTIIRDIRSMDKDVVPEIAFFGGSFTAIDPQVQERCLEIANDIRKVLGGRMYIKLSTRPDAIDDEVIDRLVKYKVDTVELGVQSMDDEVLEQANRGHDSLSVYQASRKIKSSGIQLGHQIMVGLPKDSDEKLKETVRKVILIKPDIARIYPVLVIKDTKLEQMYKNGEYSPLDLHEAVRLSAYTYKNLEKANIKVIRIGLQATDNINVDKDVVAGPFHSAFGEMVHSYLFREKIEQELVNNNVSGGVVVIKSPKECISKIIGNKKSNIIYFKNKYNVQLKVEQDQIDSVYIANKRL